MSIGTNNETYWFLLYTKPHQEDRAKKNLENQQFITFLPKIATQDLKKKSTIIKPLFPRYLFVILDINSNKLQAVKFTKGVSHIVRFGNELATIDDEIITFFQKNSDETDIFHQQLKISSYSHGEKIIIKDGLLKGKEAIFLSDDGKKRARILLEIMNNKVITDLSKKEIGEKIDEQIDYIM